LLGLVDPALRTTYITQAAQSPGHHRMCRAQHLVENADSAFLQRCRLIESSRLPEDLTEVASRVSDVHVIRAVAVLELRERASHQGFGTRQVTLHSVTSREVVEQGREHLRIGARRLLMGGQSPIEQGHRACIVATIEQHGRQQIETGDHSRMLGSRFALGHTQGLLGRLLRFDSLPVSMMWQ
jgi:hypothetical protein